MKKKHHPKGAVIRTALAGCMILLSASFPITALAAGPGEAPGGAESSSGPGAVAGGGDGPAERNKYGKRSYASGKEKKGRCIDHGKYEPV